MNNENMCRSSDLVSSVWDLVIDQGLAKVELAVNPFMDGDKFLHCDFSKKEATTGAAVFTRAVAAIITLGGLPVALIELLYGSLPVLAMCET